MYTHFNTCQNVNELGQSHPSSCFVSLADNFYFYIYILDVYNCALFLCALNCAWFIYIYIYRLFFFFLLPIFFLFLYTVYEITTKKEA